MSFLIEVRGGAAAVTQVRGVDAAFTDLAKTTNASAAGNSLLGSSTTSLSRAQKDLSATSKTAEKDLKAQKDSVAALNSGMGGLIAAFGIYEGAKFISKTMKDQQAASAQTTATLKSTGDASRETAAGIEALAKSQAQLDGVSSSTIQSSENVLLTFTNLHQGVGKSNEVFRRAVLVSQDLATAMHTGPTDAAKALGKALQEPEKGMTGLSRAGIVLSNTQKEWVKGWVENGEQLRAQDYLLGIVETKVGGSAKAFGKTLSGDVGRAKVAAEEFGESLEGIVLPSLTAMVGGVASAFLWFSQLSPEVKRTIVTLVLLAVAFATVAKAIYVVKSAFIALEAASMADPWMLAAMALITVAVLVVQHWTQVRYALQLIWKWMETAGKNVASTVSGAFNGMVKEIESAFNWVVSTIEHSWKKLESIPVLGTLIKYSPVGVLVQGVGKLAGVAGLAAGGRTLTPGIVEVGEQGPELLNLPKGAEVEPLGQNSGGGGWGEGDIVIKLDSKVLARVNKRQAMLSSAAGA